MSDLTELQEQVFNAVLAWGSTKLWFRGVCMNDFPKDDEINEGFDDAVNSVCFETAMWDDPNFFTSLVPE